MTTLAQENQQKLLDACKEYRQLLDRALAVLRAVADSYDDTGCERCGVIDAKVKRQVDKALKEIK